MGVVTPWCQRINAPSLYLLSLDDGAFSPDSLNTEYMQYPFAASTGGTEKRNCVFRPEVGRNMQVDRRKTRSMEKDMVGENTPKVSLSDLVNQGWTKIRETEPKLAHVKWKQRIKPCYMVLYVRKACL